MIERHLTPKARNIIFLFMEGGVSQVDSFDYKPMLEKHHVYMLKNGRISMAGINTKVVARSWAIDTAGVYGPRFAYDESDLCSGRVAAGAARRGAPR